MVVENQSVSSYVHLKRKDIAYFDNEQKIKEMYNYFNSNLLFFQSTVEFSAFLYTLFSLITRNWIYELEPIKGEKL